jgi:hypothetical protein
VSAVWIPRPELSPVIRMRGALNVIVCAKCGLEKPVSAAGYPVLNLTETCKAFLREHLCQK